MKKISTTYQDLYTVYTFNTTLFNPLYTTINSTIRPIHTYISNKYLFITL